MMKGQLKKLRGSALIRWWVGVLILAVVALLAAPAAAHDVQEPVTLKFMFRGGNLQEQLVQHWIKEFERGNPDIRIEWMIATTSGFQQELPLLIATGTGPDVFEMWGGDAKNLADNGFLLDLNPFIERDFTEDDIADFFPISWQASEVLSGPNKGMRMGIPSYANVFVMYYNQDMFSAAGIPFLPELDQQGSWTWDTLVDIGKKLTRRDAEGRVTQWALDDDSFVYPLGRGAGWIHAAGGKIFDLPNNPSRFMMDQPEALYALEFLQDLVWRHQILPPMDDRAQAHFHAGKSAMNLWMGSTYLNTLKERVGTSFAWDMGPRPMGPASRGYYLASDMFGISAGTKHPEEAWRFLQYLTSTAGMEAHIAIMGRGPVRRSAYPLYSELYSDVSTIYHIEGMMDGVVSPETFITNVTDARNLIYQAVRDNIVPNKMPPDQAVAQIVDAMRALYAEPDAAAKERISWQGQSWMTQDLNTVVPGQTTVRHDGALVVEASGSDIWGTRDGFRFVYQPVEGDFTATIRLHSAPDSNAWSKSGLMVRAAETPEAAYAGIFGTHTNGIVMQRRFVNGASSEQPGKASWTNGTPIYFRLIRRGNQVTGQTSPDGNSWTTLSTLEVNLPNRVFVGPASTSHAANTLGSAVFTDWKTE